MDFVQTPTHYFPSLVFGLENCLGMPFLISEDSKASIKCKDKVYLNIFLPCSQHCFCLCILCGLVLRNPQFKKLRVRVRDNGETSFGLAHTICFIRRPMLEPSVSLTMKDIA